MKFGIKNNQIQELNDDEIDYELPHANNLFGSHVNLIPMQANVAAPRQFYGARFYNQAMPVEFGEAPLVQNLMPDDPEGRSFDDYIGKFAGALRSDFDGEVTDITPDRIEFKTPEGKKSVSLYNNFAFNRKSGISHRPKVKIGDAIKPGQLLASSNYTDDNGTLAMGKNLRIGMVPLKGFSMDDAVVISEAAARALNSEHTYTSVQDFDDGVRGGLDHFRALFADRFTKDQLGNLDENGIVKPGTVLQPGDPMILATKPKMISSASAQVAKLSKTMRDIRSDASQVWEGSQKAVVTHTAKTKDGWKVVTKTYNPAEVGDKIVLRSGQKGVVAAILPDQHMLRDSEGKPMDVLLNPLGIPSRVNNSLPYELMLGKVAAKLGKPIKMAAYTKPGEARYDEVARLLAENGLSDKEKVFDPLSGRPLENPITTGVGYILKLHHVAESKANSRSQGGYDQWEAPMRGGSAGGGAKRLSGLEVGSLMSSGAYATLREGVTLRGQKNDEYWRKLRMGQDARPRDIPFAWDKFRAMLTGAGLRSKELPGGVMRLGPLTEKDIDDFNPVEIRNGGMIDLNTLEPDKGGLFDPSLVGNSAWGQITLPFRIVNPAMEDAARHLLGLKKSELQDILAGRMELPNHLR